MNATTATTATTATENPHAPGALLASMVHTRLELAAVDLEAHVAATAGALLTAATALIIALMALAFVGISVVVAFWDTHRLAAALGTTGGFAAIAAGLAWSARARWNSRPAAFDALLRELERDRAALRAAS